MEKGGDFGELEVLFTGGLILTALEMSHGFGGDFVSGSYGGLMASRAPESIGVGSHI
jgi:hypothetical protein